LGYIVLPCKLSCDYHLEIYGKNKKLKYLIQGSLCQMGIICKNLPCEDCQKATFSLIDAKSKRELTEIKKVFHKEHFNYFIKLGTFLVEICWILESGIQ